MSAQALYDATGEDSWEVLQHLVERHLGSQFASKLWTAVAEAILAVERRAALPEWLLALFQVCFSSPPPLWLFNFEAHSRHSMVTATAAIDSHHSFFPLESLS